MSSQHKQRGGDMKQKFVKPVIKATVETYAFEGGHQGDVDECRAKLNEVVTQRGTLEKCIGWTITASRLVPLTNGKLTAAAIVRVVAC